MGFILAFRETFSEETRREVVKFIEIEQCGRWPQQECTTTFFLIPKNVTSERSNAVLHTLIRWWDGLCEPEVKRWKEKHRAPS